MTVAGDKLKEFDRAKAILAKKSEDLEEARQRYQILEGEWKQAREDVNARKAEMNAALEQETDEALRKPAAD